MEDLSGWYWIIGICLGGAVVFFGWWLVSATPTAGQRQTSHQQSSALTKLTSTPAPSSSEAIMVPNEWNEREITQGLKLKRGNTDALTHYVEGLQQRFITGQDTKTMQRRTDFLRAEVERMQVGREYLQLLRGLQRLPTEEDTKDVAAQTALEDARRRQQGSAQLHALEQEAKEEKLRRKIARARKEREEIEKGPAPAPPKPSPAEERREKWQGLEQEIEEARRRKAKATAKASTDEERVKIENMYDDEIDKKLQEQRQYL